MLPSSVSVIGYANSGTHLPGDVVSSSSVNIFKGRLDIYLRTIGGLNKFSTLSTPKPLVKFAHANLPMGTK